MTSRTRQITACRWVLGFLAGLVAVLATVFGAATASAAITTGAETRVRASQPVARDIARPPEDVRAGQRLGESCPRVVGAVATGVAAKACSFTGATVVLIADGTKKPIEDVEVGAKVIATDPETGEQEAKTVEHVFVHDDTVVDLVVAGEVIATTEDPFWSVTDQQFERADQLIPGENVHGADGSVITVSRLEVGTERDALAYNLAVKGIHTFHVGRGEVLVHNTCNVPGMLGANGTQTFSTTLTKPGLKYRIDVENPAPGVRPGQLHFQQGSEKYLYDFDAGTFVDMPNSMQKMIARDPNVARAIEKGRSVLGLE